MGATLKERNIRKSFESRLVEMIHSWKKFMSPMLEKRNKMISIWGSRYFQDGLVPSRILNLTERAIGILAPYLVMSNPKALVTTRFKNLRPFAYTTELAINFHNEETKFDSRCLRPAVINAFIGAGIVKTGIMTSHEVEIQGNMYDIGEIYSDVIDDADFIGDFSAKHVDAFDIIGNLYQMPTEIAKAFFDTQYADDIKPVYGRWGKPRPEDIVNPEHKQQYRIRDYSEFADIYIPDEGIIITIDPHSSNPKILRTVEWDGPDSGPYDILGFEFLPQNPMPMPPVWNWLSLEDTLNVIIKKMKEQAEREKSVLAYGDTAEKDAKRLAKTSDGGTCRVSDVSQMEVINYPGINEGYYPWINYLENEFSVQGSNLYVLGGRTTQAETLGQEQMMMANSSRAVDDMLNQVYNFTKSIMYKRAWFLWNDPLIDLPLVKRVAQGIEVEVDFNQVSKEGDFYQYSFNIVPYSMQRQGPDTEYRRLMTYLSQVAIPLAPLMAQSGKQLDGDAITTMLARYMNIDELDSIFTSEIPINHPGLNPYSPQAGMAKPKNKAITNGRTGDQTASNEANSMQANMRMGQPL